MTTASAVLAVATALIAVLGTLGAQALSGVLTGRFAQRNADRAALVRAIADLDAAVNAHRLTMWYREDLRLGGKQAAFEAARVRSHETRSAVSAPLATVCVLAPWLATAARTAAQASYDLRNAATDEVLAALRERSLVASERLVTSASQRLGVGAVA